MYFFRIPRNLALHPTIRVTTKRKHIRVTVHSKLGAFATSSESTVGKNKYNIYLREKSSYCPVVWRLLIVVDHPVITQAAATPCPLSKSGGGGLRPNCLKSEVRKASRPGEAPAEGRAEGDVSPVVAASGSPEVSSLVSGGGGLVVIRKSEVYAI